MVDTDVNESRPRKRRMNNPTHKACKECKARKIRCDAARPRCAFCASRSTDCVFPPVYKRAHCSQAEVDEMKSKLSKLESQLQAQKDGWQTISTAPAGSTESYLAESGHGSQNKIRKPATFGPAKTAVPERTPGIMTDTQMQSQWWNVAATGLHDQGEIAQHTLQSAPTPQWPTNHYPKDDPPLSAQNNKKIGDPQSQPRTNSQIARSGNAGRTPLVDDEDKESTHLEPASGFQVGVDDSDSDSTTESPITDGMVEYNATFPGASRVGESFESSATFDFALKIRASMTETSKSDPRSERIPHIFPGLSTATGNYGVSPATSAGESTTKKADHQNDPSNLDALKSYLNQSSLMFLPQRHVANALFDHYFATVHPIWPFLIEDATRERFNLTWSSNDTLKPIWLAQLNLIFALACQFYDSDAGAPLIDVYNEGRRFYERANGFIVAHAFNICSIFMLQILLLAVQYQQGTMRPNECWLTTGHATRMALGLGLHTNSRLPDSVDRLERQLRKRLWWGCFALDRVSSMIYGRPIGIPHVNTPTSQNNLPSAVDDKYIACGESQPEGIPSLNAFFVSSTRLYQVMDDILERLHKVLSAMRPNTEDNMSNNTHYSTLSCAQSPVSQLAAILQQDSLLLNWHDSLEPHLRFSLDSLEGFDDYDPIIHRQRTVLKNRFLGLRILLHRRTLLFLLQPSETRRWPWNASHKWPPLFLDNSEESTGNGTVSPGRPQSHSPSEIHLARLSAHICVSSAHLQLEVIDYYRPLKKTGAWWWDFHFTFNSLCILFGAMGLQQMDLKDVIQDYKKTQHLIERGLSNIHSMTTRGGSKVVQSEKFLKSLMKTMLRRREEGVNLEEHTRQDQAQPQSANESLGSQSAWQGNGIFPNASDLRHLPTTADLIDMNIMAPDKPIGTGAGIPNLSNLLMSWDGTGDSDGFADTSFAMDPTMMGNLLQSSFDDWTALDGPSSLMDQNFYSSI